MSTVKTQVNQEQLHSFFEDHFHIDEPQYRMIEGGEISQAYFVDTPDGERVLRFNADMKEGFEKDAYAAEHFSSYGVPVPRVIEVGELATGVFFSVSEKVPGKVMDEFTTDEVNGFMPEFIRVLDAIHSIPAFGDGYGYWRLDGSGKFSSLQASVLAGLKENDDDKLGSIAFFEPDLHQRVIDQINKLLPNLPNERHLIHNDFGFGNVLADGTHITGVIDWHSSAYGDPVSDVAWLEFWREEQGFARQFSEFYEAQGRLPENFEQRLKCYMLTAAANSMAFFAKSEQPDKYKFSRQRAIQLLA